MMCEAHRLVVRRDAASHRIGWGLAVCTSSRGRTVCSLYQLTLRWRWWLGDGSGQQGDCAYTDSRTRASVWLRRGFAPVLPAVLRHVGTDGSRRVPDVTCLDPRTNTDYVIDARIFWNSMSDGASGYTAYQWTGWGATHGEQEKRTSWKKALKRRQDESTHHIEFVPFSMEAGGVWGPCSAEVFQRLRV
jgi:hypothetical protein